MKIDDREIKKILKDETVQMDDDQLYWKVFLKKKLR